MIDKDIVTLVLQNLFSNEEYSRAVLPHLKEEYFHDNDEKQIYNTIHSYIDKYNDILIIASSCWQSMTEFEEKFGNLPYPCKVPWLNLKTREVKILDFSDSEEKSCEVESVEVKNG